MILADVAPRLALARDQWQHEQHLRIARQRERERAVGRLRWLVEHRELQLLRAEAARRPRRYLALRAAKLEQARTDLRRIERAV
ncbi:MAG: hypothetical protein ACYCQK_01895 [Acidiferrobacteraceae bacterium]